MKITIEKSASSQKFRFELTYDTGKPPAVLELQPDDLERLLQMIETARKAKKVKFELEM